MAYDLTTLTPGDIIGIDDKSGGFTFTKYVVFVGIDRGLAAIAEGHGGYNDPFYIDPQDPDAGYLGLRRTTWTPRRVRATTVQGTRDAIKAAEAAERQAKIDAERAARNEQARRDAALKAVAEAIEAFPGVKTYVTGGRIAVYGDVEGIEAAAAAIAGLAVAA